MIVIAYIVLYGVAFFVFFILVPTVCMHVLWMMPYVPTPMNIVNQALDLAKLKGRETIYDLGAGDGRTVIEAKRRHPKIKATGFEIAIGVWLLAQLRLFRKRSKAKVLLKNFMEQDLSDADVIFTYLSPRFMRMLLPKFKAELKKGTVIVSHAFKLPGKKPIISARCEAPIWGSKNLFVYRW